MESTNPNTLDLSEEKVGKLEAISQHLRKRVFEVVQAAANGHLGGSSSSVELMTAMYFGGVLNYNLANPSDPDRDRVMVRGHLGPLRYNIFALLGWIDKGELNGYRDINSRLEGHEPMGLPGVDITPSGSLGMLLSYGVGSSLVAKNQGKDFKSYVFLGDGEEQEGNVSEAARAASHLGLDNLVAILDKNGKQLGFPTHKYEQAIDIKKIWEGYGWEVIEIQNGHNIVEILNAFNGESNGRPKLIIANTIKGFGIIDADKSENGYHTLSTCPPQLLADSITQMEEKVLTGEQIDELLKEMFPVSISDEQKEISDAKQDIKEPIVLPKMQANTLPPYIGKTFQSLINIYRNRPTESLYIMTADVLRTEDAKALKDLPPNVHYLNVGIKEQHLFSMTHGIYTTDPDATCLLITGEAFAYRASDQLNALAQGETKAIIIGINPGIGGAKNGPTHQSTGQQGMLASMPGLTVYDPWDIKDLHIALEKALNNQKGPVYIRVHDMEITQDVEGERGNSYVAYEPVNTPKLTIVSSGLTVGASIDAAKDFDKDNIGVKVISVTDLNALDDEFAEMIIGDKPLLTVFNGNPQVLEGAVAAALFKYKGPRPSVIQAHGFTYGKSGGLKDLAKYLYLDKDGIKLTASNLLLDS